MPDTTPVMTLSDKEPILPHEEKTVSAVNVAVSDVPARRNERTIRQQWGRSGGRRGAGGNRGRQGARPDVPAESDYEEKNLEIARVTRVTKGGKRMRFRALIVIGNRKGRVGYGMAKGADVALATSKATAQARKSLLSIPILRDTIPHMVEARYKAAHVLLKPAPLGSGVKAGGAIRAVLELAGVPNIVSKMLGSSNKMNNVKATCIALKKLRVPALTHEKETGTSVVSL